MGTDDDITRYRPDPWSRWAPPGIGLVMLALWSFVIIRDGDVGLFPVVIALSLAASAITGWFSLSSGVTFTPDALVVRTYRGTTVHPWSAITTLERRWNVVWVMTAKGWFILPVAGTRRASGQATQQRLLGDAIWWTWHERRGDDWAPEVLDPWEPTFDRAGRALLRPPFESRLVLTVVSMSTLGTTLIPNQRPGGLAGSLVGFGAFVSVATLTSALYHWWARVTVSADEIIVRSATMGRVRVPLGQAFHLRESVDSLALTSSRRFTRLSFDVYAPDEYDPWPRFRRTVRLPGPATTQRSYGSDPAYYRKCAWLHDVLAAATAVDVGPDHRSSADGDAPSRARSDRP